MYFANISRGVYDMTPSVSVIRHSQRLKGYVSKHYGTAGESQNPMILADSWKYNWIHSRFNTS